MRLRVMSYNIHRAIGIDRRFRLERIAEIIAHHAPDIALLQEVDEGAPRSAHRNLARELAHSLDYPALAEGYNVTLRTGQYGNATMSRYPILRARNINLTIGTRKRRGCQHTTLEVARKSGTATTLEVFNLHLGLSAQERARQAGVLVRSREFATLEKNGACLVGGDFNDWRLLLHPVFTDILQFSSATQRRDSFKDGLRTFPAFSPRGALDRIYYRGPLRLLVARTCRLKASRVASDHLPVVADFVLI